MDFSIPLAIFAIIAASVFVFFKHRFGYWSRRNVPFIKPIIPFGNLRGVGKKIHISQLLYKFYLKMKQSGPMCGLFFFMSPVVMAIDMELIKNIFIKDFNSFQHRGVFYNEKDDPLSAHLFALDGPKWKRLRSKLTPTFTSGKMKFMFPTVVDVASKFQQCLTDLVEQNDVLEMKELLARFTTDVIGACAFGIECNSLTDPKAQFRAIGKKVFSQQRHTGLVLFLIFMYKDLARKLHIKMVHDDVSEFFLGIVRETMDIREKNKIRRNDFMDLLIELRDSGTMDGENVGNITFEEIAAQAFVFFLAGFETSSTTMSYAIYELSNNLDIQTKARDEIMQVLEKHNGQLTYDAMMEMHYLDCIINEALRKYPPVAHLIRENNEPYFIESANVTIAKDTMFLIPVYAIHHDPEYYPDPEKFDPDRFSSEGLKTRPHESFLPFGQGPRNCIGLRFGMMQSRIGLITLLRHFEMVPCAQSKAPPLEFEPKSAVLTSKTGLFLKFKPIK